MKPRLILALLLTLVVAGASVANELDQHTGLGALQGLPTFFNSTAQSTTPVKATIVNASSSQAVRAKICNGDESNVLAWSIVVEGASAPTITADYAATGASVIYAQHCEFIPLQGDRDLYVVASAASTEVNVTSFIVQ